MTFWALVTDSYTSASVIGICAFTEDKRLQALLLTKCPKYPSSPTKVRLGPNNALLSICVKSYQALYVWRGPLFRHNQMAWNQQNQNKWAASTGDQMLMKTIIFQRSNKVVFHDFDMNVAQILVTCAMPRAELMFIKNI